MLMENGRQEYGNNPYMQEEYGDFEHCLNMSGRGGGYDVSCGCRNYAPQGSVRTMNMTDYRSCDSCRHLQDGAVCGMAQQSLS